jgi:hypothetical protein
MVKSKFFNDQVKKYCKMDTSDIANEIKKIHFKTHQYDELKVWFNESIRDKVKEKIKNEEEQPFNFLSFKEELKGFSISGFGHKIYISFGHVYIADDCTKGKLIFEQATKENQREELGYLLFNQQGQMAPSIENWDEEYFYMKSDDGSGLLLLLFMLLINNQE